MRFDNSFALVKERRPVCAIVVGSAKEDIEAGKILRKKVEEIVGVNLKMVDWKQGTSGEKQVLIGTPYSNPKIKEILSDAEVLVTSEDKQAKITKRILTAEDLDNQGFIIYKSSDDRSLILSGKTHQGVFYATITTISRLCLNKEKLVIDNLNSELIPIINEPALKYRSIATNIGGPDWLGYQQWEKEWGYDYKGFIDWLAEHKINHLNIWTFGLCFGIAYDSKKFPECVNRYHPNVKREFIKDLIDYAHQRYIEVFFHMDFPENWTAIIKAHPELAGKNIDISQMLSGEEWIDYQKKGYIRYRDKNHRLVRRPPSSWVCASNPKVMSFWEEYWDELLDRYPNVDGIGGQFAEGHNNRCNCENCQENFFQLEFKYFAKMAEIGRSKNSDVKLWFYDAWGARDILRNKDKFFNITYVDWGAKFESFLLGHRLPRSDWYLYHRMANEFGGEFGIKQCAQAFAKRKLEGFQMRMVHYKEIDQIYQALEEFSWNPYLSIDDFAYLYVVKKLNREDEPLARLYASWIKSRAYKEILTGTENRLPGISPGIRKKYQKAIYKEQENISALSERISHQLCQLIGGDEL